MPFPLNRRITARLIFITSIFLMLLGSAFLLGSMAGASRLTVLGSFFFVIIGAFCAVLAVKLNKRSLYLFFASFFMLVGFFFLLSALGIIPLPISRLWPLLSVFAGLALFPAGWHRYRKIRVRYLVPSLAFAILGCGLLIFSLDMVPFSFKQFILKWWPLLIVLAGLTLLLISLSPQNKD